MHRYTIEVTPMGVFDNVPVLSGAEDAAGTVATGTVDSLIADPGNALLGVNADNMGIFEEQAAGSKAVSIGTLGLAGEGGLLTDVLVPGQGKPGSTTGTGIGGGQGTTDAPVTDAVSQAGQAAASGSASTSGMSPLVLVALAAGALLLLRSD